MGRRVKVTIGYLLGAFSLAIPYLTIFIVFSGAFNVWAVIGIASMVQILYLISISILTFDDDIKIRMLKNDIKEYEKITSSEKDMLKILVKKTIPNVSIINDAFLVKYGHEYRSNYENPKIGWVWYENRLDHCSEEELLNLYAMCKKSWF